MKLGLISLTLMFLVEGTTPASYEAAQVQKPAKVPMLIQVPRPPNR